MRIYIRHPDGRNHVMSYPKYLMEVHLGRFLTKEETVDHIDYNPLNNDLKNLQVVDRKQHIVMDKKWLVPQSFVCPVCGKTFEASGDKLHNIIADRKRNPPKVGPFCSKSCAGKYGKFKQVKQLELKIIEPKYTTLKLSGYDGNHNMNLPKSVKPGDGNAELADYGSRASVETLQETPRTGEDKVQTTIRK